MSVICSTEGCDNSVADEYLSCYACEEKYWRGKLGAELQTALAQLAAANERAERARLEWLEKEASLRQSVLDYHSQRDAERARADKLQAQYELSKQIIECGRDERDELRATVARLKELLQDVVATSGSTDVEAWADTLSAIEDALEPKVSK